MVGVEKKLSDNAGLVQYMNDWGSCSRSFAQFPATLVPRAIALESAFGTNYDNAGRYHKLLPDVSLHGVRRWSRSLLS